MKYLKYFLLTIPAAIFLMVGYATFLYMTADMGQPNVRVDLSMFRVDTLGNHKECNGSYIRQSESGLWELMLSGSDHERGAAFGLLANDLLYYQESVFINQIREFIPSDSYLRFLKYLTIIFNRDMGECIPGEFRNEIYSMSLSCTHEYDAIGTPYARQVNYHAAHDIGHAMQNYMLVGCSSLGVWGDKSADSSMIIGRNFDFYVGDDFARNKIVTFVDPEKGYRFASVGWAGMVGVLSGMNEKGLTVTLNAAKGDMPVRSALPISLLAREILQYASNISEAYEIAASRKIFVSESLLIGSLADNRASIIEKTPASTALFEPDGNSVICTNHFQSEAFANDSYNVDNIKNSDSKYRFDRISEMLGQYESIDTRSMASMLRDRYGLGNEDIGLGHEKLINQSIAHHSVIFKPEQLQMWVSTTHWQSGGYVCYDLNEIFNNPDFSREINDQRLYIGPDTAFINNDYPSLIAYRAMKAELRLATRSIAGSASIDEAFVDSFISSNPNHYNVYKQLGDYYASKNSPERARHYWSEALSKEIPTIAERVSLENLIK